MPIQDTAHVLSSLNFFRDGIRDGEHVAIISYAEAMQLLETRNQDAIEAFLAQIVAENMVKLLLDDAGVYLVSGKSDDGFTPRIQLPRNLYKSIVSCNITVGTSAGLVPDETLVAWEAEAFLGWLNDRGVTTGTTDAVYRNKHLVPGYIDFKANERWNQRAAATHTEAAAAVFKELLSRLQPTATTRIAVRFQSERSPRGGSLGADHALWNAFDKVLETVADNVSAVVSLLDDYDEVGWFRNGRPEPGEEDGDETEDEHEAGDDNEGEHGEAMEE